MKATRTCKRPYGRIVLAEDDCRASQGKPPAGRVTHPEVHGAIDWLERTVTPGRGEAMRAHLERDAYAHGLQSWAFGVVMAEVPLDERPVNVPPLRIATVTTSTASGGRGAADPWGSLTAALATGADVILAPEWFFPYCSTPQEFNRIVERLLALSRGSAALIVPGTIAMADRKGRYRNIALAICNGRVLYTYAKRTDGGDHTMARNQDAAGWEPGARDGTFSWRGLHVGVEICADHSTARLRWDNLQEGREPLALQLVTSCGMVPVPRSAAVGSGGLVVAVDGLTAQASVQRVANGALSGSGAGRSTAPGAKCVAVFDVPASSPTA